MNHPVSILIASAAAMVVLTLIVGLRLLFVRMGEMRRKHIHPQSISTSVQRTTQFEDVRAADNFKNLFEVPVLFYALVATAVAVGHVPLWLTVGAWVFVVLRALHSFIHCTYNQVMHRFAVFFLSFIVVSALWISFAVSLPPNGG